MSQLVNGYKVYRILPCGLLGNPMYLPHMGLKFKVGHIVRNAEFAVPHHPNRTPDYPLGVHFFLSLADARMNLERWKAFWFFGPAAIVEVEGPSDHIINEDGTVHVAPWIRFLSLTEIFAETRDGKDLENILIEPTER